MPTYEIEKYATTTEADAYTVNITNDAKTLPTTTGGTVTYTDSGTTISVFKGTKQLQAVASGTTPTFNQFGVTQGDITDTNITKGSQSVSGTDLVFGNVSSITASQALVTYPINIENVITISKTQTFSKSQQGATGSAGVGGYSVKLTSSKYVINYSTAGVESDTITFTADGSGAAGTETFKFLVDSGSGFVEKQAASTTATYAMADGDEPAIGQSRVIKVIFYDDDVEKAIDSVSIFAVQDGADAITIILTNDSHTIPTNASGASGDYTGSGTDIRVWKGGTALAYHASNASTFSIGTPDDTDITVGSASTVSTYTRRYAVASAFTTGTSTKTATISFPITVRDAASATTVINKIQTFSKSIKGDDGDDGQGIKYASLYKLNDSTITTNNFGTFADPTSGAESGWTIAVPDLGTTENNTIYVTTRTFTSDGASPQTSTWTAPVIHSKYTKGAAGLRTIQGYLYYEKTTSVSSAPSTPGSTTYTFSTGDIDGGSGATEVLALADTSAVDKWTNQPRPNVATSSNTFWTVRYFGTEASAGASTITVSYSNVVKQTSFTGVVTFSGGTFSEDGSAITTIDGGNISTGSVDANKVAAGSFTVTGGGVGGWSINSTSIYTGTEDHSGYTANDGDMTIYSNGTDSSIHAKNFYITTAGDLVARDVDLTGAITATSGSFTGTVTSTAGAIGGWTLASTDLHAGSGSTYIALDKGNSKLRIGAKASLTDSNTGVHLGSDGLALGASSVFKVTNAGVLTATSATITGAITATSGSFTGTVTSTAGTIGGWTLGSTSMSSASSSPKIQIVNEAHSGGPYILISE